MSKQDGGPAFPGEYVSKRLDGNPNEWRYFPGMTLRDWFAGQALAGMLAEASTVNPYGNEYRIAKQSYDIADAMLTERAKP